MNLQNCEEIEKIWMISRLYIIYKRRFPSSSVQSPWLLRDKLLVIKVFTAHSQNPSKEFSYHITIPNIP